MRLLPQLNCERVAEYITQRLRWYILEYAGKKSGVVGLSGGIDSAVTTYLTVKALGPDKTYCYILPSEITPREDVEDAMETIHRLKIPEGNCEIIRIDEVVSDFEKILGNLSKVERGNVMARVRMIILHQRAYKHQGLVIGTGDKSELLLGYFTKYGDGGVDVLPIGGLYKTYVKELGKYLGVPDRIIRKPPSPALWSGQTAEGEIGLSYETIDSILYLRFEKWIPEDQVAEMLKIPRSAVDRVLKMVKNTQHKRLPPEIFHIGYRDLGSDWRYPRQWF